VEEEPLTTSQRVTASQRGLCSLSGCLLGLLSWQLKHSHPSFPQAGASVILDSAMTFSPPPSNLFWVSAVHLQGSYRFSIPWMSSAYRQVLFFLFRTVHHWLPASQVLDFFISSKQGHPVQDWSDTIFWCRHPRMHILCPLLQQPALAYSWESFFVFCFF
jgi:hypothetical protein